MQGATYFKIKNLVSYNSSLLLNEKVFMVVSAILSVIIKVPTWFQSINRHFTALENLVIIMPLLTWILDQINGSWLIKWQAVIFVYKEKRIQFIDFNALKTA